MSLLEIPGQLSSSERQTLHDAIVNASPRPEVALEVMKTLADCQPVDDPASAFLQLRFLQPQVTNWKDVQRICREISSALSAKLIKE